MNDKPTVIIGAGPAGLKAYPVYDHDYQRRLRLIRDYLAHFENLQTIGRNGLHRYNIASCRVGSLPAHAGCLGKS